METMQIDKQLIKKLEEQEIKYWSDYHFYSSPGVQEKLGMQTNIIAGSFCGTLSTVDTLFLNRTLGLGIDSEIDNDLINDIIRFFREAGAPRFFVHDSPAARQENISQLLQANGFTHHNNWVKLYRHLEEKFPVKSSNINIEELSLMDAGLYEELIEDAFELEGGSCMLFSQTIGKPGWKHYAAYIEGKPAAAASLYYNSDYASLAMAGTLPEYRGLGVQGALVTRRLNDAIDLGCTLAVVETAEDTVEKPSPSFRNMLKYGFEQAYVRPNYVYTF